jgi:hypothetical protein
MRSIGIESLMYRMFMISRFKVDNSFLVTFWIIIFRCERYVVWCGSKNKYQKDMFSKETGMCAQEDDNHSRLKHQHNWGSKWWTLHWKPHTHTHTQWDRKQAHVFMLRISIQCDKCLCYVSKIKTMNQISLYYM